MPKFRCSGPCLVIAALVLAGCAAQRVIDVRSANQDGRVRFLVLHFTDENFERSLDLLTRPHENPVSAHYLVSRAHEVVGHAAPTVLRLVDESQRAWHAGPSRWQGHESLNGESIGIEIVYESHCPREPPRTSPSAPSRSPSAPGRSPSAPGRSPSAPEAMDGREGPPEAMDGREGPPEAMDGREGPRDPARPPGTSPGAGSAQISRGPWDVDAICAYPEWPADQIDAVIVLARDILARHPEIEPSRVVGHADVQPENKTDPGPRFPWRRLAEAGIGAWYDDADVAWYRGELARAAGQVSRGTAGAAATVLPLKTVQEALAAYGYGVAASGVADLRTREVLSAFQSHFLPQRRSGDADGETIATLFALLARYRGDELRALRERSGQIPPPPPARQH
jgi:N-acetyl-anhydromuramyl-L-alanine amidase AmpD